MSSPSLFSITQYHAQLFAHIEANEGEITDELAQALEITQHELAVKTGRILDFRQTILANIAMADERIKQMQSYQKSQQRLQARLEGLLEQAVNHFGTLTADTRTVTFRKSHAVELNNSVPLPAKYQRQKITNEPNKELLTKDLKAGVEIAGAAYVERKKLWIK